MRAYFFGNMYLSSIQQGIQALHCTSEMSVKYEHDSKQHQMYVEWAKDHKTVVALNAGFGCEITDLNCFFTDPRNEYPYAVFHEEEAALNNAATSIGIVLPPEIYETARLVRDRQISIDDLKIAQQEVQGLPVPMATGQIDQQIRIGTAVTQLQQHFDVKEVLAEFTNFHFDLIQRLNQYGLAR